MIWFLWMKTVQRSFEEKQTLWILMLECSRLSLCILPLQLWHFYDYLTLPVSGHLFVGFHNVTYDYLLEYLFMKDQLIKKFSLKKYCITGEQQRLMPQENILKMQGMWFLLILIYLFNMAIPEDRWVLENDRWLLQLQLLPQMWYSYWSKSMYSDTWCEIIYLEKYSFSYFVSLLRRQQYFLKVDTQAHQ